jgi:hypothetical protein
MKTTLTAAVSRIHTKGEDSKDLYMFLIFPGFFDLLGVTSITDITLNGVPIVDVPELLTCNIYLGDQSEADPMLLEHMPGWTETHVGRRIPYLSMHAVYDPIFKTDVKGGIVVTATLEG